MHNNRRVMTLGPLILLLLHEHRIWYSFLKITFQRVKPVTWCMTAQSLHYLSPVAHTAVTESLHYLLPAAHTAVTESLYYLLPEAHITSLDSL
jgi:hypothetical protein